MDFLEEVAELQFDEVVGVVVVEGEGEDEGVDAEVVVEGEESEVVDVWVGGGVLRLSSKTILNLQELRT